MVDEALIDDLRTENPTAPAVDLTAPATGGTVDLTASASDASGVSTVEFYVDRTLLAVDTASPYAATCSCTGWTRRCASHR